MRNFLCIFFLYTVCSHLQATEEPVGFAKATTAQEVFIGEQNIATLGGEPSAMVDGCVNAITGTFIDSGIDLWAPGPDPLYVERIYTHTSGWSINEPENVEMLGGSLNRVVHEEKGMKALYTNTLIGRTLFIDATNYSQGLTNCSKGFISGKSNPHNLQMQIVSPKPGTFAVYLRDGSKSLKYFGSSHRTPLSLAAIRYQHGLTYEQKPYGIKTQYTYQKSPLGWKIGEISHTNSLQQDLGIIYFEYDNFKLNPRMVAYANKDKSGSCEYLFSNYPARPELHQVISTNAPKICYSYDDTTHRMKQKALPNGRCKQIEYYDETNPCAYTKKPLTFYDTCTSPYERVSCLKAAVGTDQTLHPTHRFYYEVNPINRKSRIYSYPGGTTRVLDLHNQETRYHHDSKRRLTGIDKLLDSNLYRTQSFFWSSLPHLEGCLTTKTLQDGQGNLLSSRYYDYDKNGNIKHEWLLGNLTGNAKGPVLNKEGIPIAGQYDSYIRTYEYSDDGYNHLLREQDGCKEIVYLYYPKSALLHKKLMRVNNKIVYREFYTYNSNGSITRYVYDDGHTLEEDDLTGITERHSVYTSYRDQFPVGLPEIIEEKYLDLALKEEILLRKTQNFHDHQGRITQQTHFDSNGQPHFTLHWDYDAHGNILKETNALGHASFYQYDENDNLIFEQHPGKDFHTVHEYDFSNRRICSKDIHADQTLVTHYAYNGLSQKVAMTNWQGETTQYTYDHCGRLIKTIYPKLLDADGNFHQPFECIEYDIADNPIGKTDRRGFKTTYNYNIRGQPCLIQHPDGSTEKNEYTLEGYLAKSIALNGKVTQTDYDYLGRACRQMTFAPTGEKLSETTTHYNHFHKIAEVDAEGQFTYYQYDAAGRLASIVKNEAKTAYQYDACQRLAKTLEYFGPEEKDYIANVKEYDAMDRLIEERTEDAEGQVLTKIGYLYNEQGKPIQTIAHHQAKPVITFTHYNAYGEVESVIDPQGHTTRTLFYYLHLNQAGQYVYAKETIDAIGQSFFQEHDSCGHVRLEIRRDPMGVLLQKREFFYDAEGLCCKQIEHVLAPHQPDRLVTTHFEYDFAKNLISCTEAVGNPEQKQTKYVYNAYRQKEKVIKPDGIELHYAYDWLGRLTSFSSTDHSLHYHYTYDANSNVVGVEDKHTGKSTTRIFDNNKRLVQETLSHGLTQKYSYDNLDRIQEIILPDDSSIQYSYKSLYLHQISRGPYRHTYQHYNLSGALEEAKLMAEAGSLQYAYDAYSRLISISSKYLKENIPENGFDQVGHLLKRTTLDPVGQVNHTYTYDGLYQLQSEKGLVDHTYCHDSLYNRVEKNKIPHSVNALNQLLHDGLDPHVYDLNGNLIRKGSLNLSYDALDRLIAIHTPTQQVTYVYDELNRRLSSTFYSRSKVENKWLPEKEIRYMYHGLSEIGACDSKGNIEQLRILGKGKGAEIEASVLLELQGKAYIPIHDTLGNIRLLINAKTHTIEETYRYTAYGQEFIYGKNNKLSKQSINPWRFSSKRVDAETQFVYFGRRYYNPTTGRWISADPLSFEAGPNLYAYVLNNPLNDRDLYGLRGSNPSRWEKHRESVIMYGKERASYRMEKTPLRGKGENIKNLPRVSFTDRFERNFVRCESSSLAVLLGSKSENFRLGVHNGIMTTQLEAINNAIHLRELGWEYSIDVIHNATHNLLNDCIESGLGLCYTATTPVRVNHETWDKFFDEYPRGEYFQICHSQGAINVRNALLSYDEKLRKQITVLAIAPAAYMYADSCRKAYHYRAEAWRDPIPYIDVGGLIRSKRDTVTLNSCPGAAFHDHSFQSPTYEGAIDDHINTFLKNRR
ncbi:RHS repeat-associated core domain-containing protein [Neochlamydia sp. AcF84]|uniref:RHS repeat-associated core domain-containing protein n=1 Tax=Neochlamydia sp. AcF84 TaxID=2315858 RepID=UPI001407DD81|nr:RHS repeat-associated core domain-containing protein [Neochlamydia sp. AcF84]